MYLQETEWFEFLPSNDFTIADNNLSTIGHYHLNKSTIKASIRNLSWYKLLELGMLR